MCLELAYGAASRCVYRNSNLDSAYWTKVQYTGSPVLIEDSWTAIGGRGAVQLDQPRRRKRSLGNGYKGQEEDEGCKLESVLPLCISIKR